MFVSAQQCYQNTAGLFDCTNFVKNNLPAMVDNQAPCPFQDGICRSNSSNIRLDTGLIDIMDDLGINAPDDERIQFRTVLHCAPLETRGYSSEQSTSGGNITAYHYGYSFALPPFTNATYAIKSVQSQYNHAVNLTRQQWGENLIVA